LPFAPLAKGAAMAAGRYAGPELARGLENYMVKSGAVLPMDVWHGSPHRFPPTAKNPLGEFDPMKIGTGEGAQAYGVGAGYLAEAKGTAKGYAETLANRDIANQGRLNAHANAQRLANLAGDAKYAADDVRYALETNPQGQEQLLRDTLQHLESGSYARPLENKGNLYKVDLPDEQIAKMLDWDKPLSQQTDLGKKISPESLGLTYKQLENGNHAFVNSEGKVFGNLQTNGSKESFIKNWTENVLRGSGRDLYNQLGQGMGGGAKVSEALRQAGIPGIRYLDQGSRAGGAGTSNFVVFDPKHMNIIGRE